jgi:hypothetical protein
VKARPDRSQTPDEPSKETGSTAIPTPPVFSEGKPRPIGPKALKALRDAIRDGTYPSDRAVRAGILRMFRRP